MENLNKQLENLSQDLETTSGRLDIEGLSQELSDLQSRSEEPDFWGNQTEAQAVMQQISKLQNKVEPWHRLKKSLEDARELIGLGDAAMETELNEQIEHLSDKLAELKKDLKLNGKYDDHDAILSIYAGAGGTDAQDWTQMLLRMYSRYFENQNWKVEVVDSSAGEEAGLKSVTLEVSGSFAFGKLKGEHGVHRLVRLSPFNSDNLRQTSFAKVEVMPKINRPDELVIDPKDLKIDVYRSGGHGGQSVNTTDSAVRATHLPTGINVAIQNERSQLQNRETAMTILRSRLLKLQMDQHLERLGDLKGPNQSAEWGNQIRSYVLHPYKQVKDLRTRYETSDPDAVLDGNLDALIDAYLDYSMSQS